MTLIDYILPHRYFANKSLQKQSDKLNEKIRNYENDCKMKIDKLNIELENLKTKYDDDYQLTKEKMINELKNEAEILYGLQDKIIDYCELFYRIQSLKEKKKIKVHENNIYWEEKNFYIEYIKLLKGEIEIYTERKIKLLHNIDISDIVVLLKLSGNEIKVEANDMSQINELINTLSEVYDCTDDYIVKRTLKKTLNVLNEKSDIVPMINYIDWVIKQKETFITKLKYKKNEMNKKLNFINKDIKQLQNEINQLNNTLNLKAQIIRDFWVKPLVDINVSINNDYFIINSIPNHENYNQIKSEIANDFDELKKVNAEIQKMKDDRSDDSDRWEYLQKKRKNIYSEITEKKEFVNKIALLKKDIWENNKLKKIWNQRRSEVIQIFKDNHVFLLKEKMKIDEERVIHNIINELELKKKNEKKQDEEEISALKQKVHNLNDKYSEEIIKIKIQINEKVLLVHEHSKKVNELTDLKKHSLFLYMFIPDSQDLIYEKNQLYKLMKELKDDKNKLHQLENERSNVERDLEKKITMLENKKYDAYNRKIKKYEEYLERK